MKYLFVVGTIAAALLAHNGSLASEFDWPQWQGPQRNAMSKETGLLKEWPKEGPPLAWRVKGLGGGDSAPSIAAGQIYGMGISARAKSYEPCLLAPRTKTHRTPHLPLDQSVVA